MGAAEGEFTFAAWDRNSGFNDYVYAYATEAVEQAARDRRAPNYAWEAAAGASDQASAAAAALAVNTSAWSTGRAAERIAQASLLRDIFGPIPLKPVTIHPEVLAWSDGTVRKIAQGIYEERAFDRLPILADALRDAGCDDEDILAHCRGEGPHVRGCWVIDLILGKE